MLSTTVTSSASLSKSIAEVVDNFGLEEKIVGITSEGGGNPSVCRESLESKYRNGSIIRHPSSSSPWIALRIYWQGLARRECNLSSRMMVKLTQNL